MQQNRIAWPASTTARIPFNAYSAELVSSSIRGPAPDAIVIVLLAMQVWLAYHANWDFILIPPIVLVKLARLPVRSVLQMALANLAMLAIIYLEQVVWLALDWDV